MEVTVLCLWGTGLGVTFKLFGSERPRGEGLRPDIRTGSDSGLRAKPVRVRALTRLPPAPRPSTDLIRVEVGREKGPVLGDRYQSISKKLKS